MAGLAGLLALGLLLGLQAIEPRFFLRDDNATHFLPAYEYAYETVAGEGEIPLLNQHQMFGGTFLASGQTGFFLYALYPVRALFGLFGVDPVWLVDVLATLHFLLAGLGMFLLLRSWGLRPGLAVPLALCWCFLPFAIIAARSWIFVSYLAAYLPFQQWLLQRWLASPSLRGWLQLAALKVLFLFTGYLHYAILAFFFEGCFLLAYFLLAGGERRVRLRRAAALGGAYVLAAMLAAPLLLPTWNAKQVSWQRAQPMAKEAALAFPLRPADFAAANLLQARTRVYGDLSSAVFFLGPLWLAGLALAGGRLVRRAPARLGPELGAALLVGIFALLMSTRLFGLLAVLPVFDVLRWPFKGFPLAAFYLLLAAARVLLHAAGEGGGKARLAAGLAWLNLLLQLAILLPAAWRAPIGPWKLEGTVAELRAAPLVQAIGDQGRLLLLQAEGEQPGRSDALGLGFLYATLAGKYHVHGYDPLVAKINAEIGFPAETNGALVVRAEEWPRLAPALPRWVLVDEASRLLPLLDAAAAFRRLASGGHYVLFENARAIPIVTRAEGGEALPFRWRTNGLELDLPADFPGGHLLFNVAGLPEYRGYRNGESLGAPELLHQRPLLAVPPGAGHVELRYQGGGFRLGLGLAALGLLGVLLLLRRAGRPADPATPAG